MILHEMMAWGCFLVIVLGLLAIDLFVLHRKPHEIRFKEALIGSLIPVTIAILFAGVVYLAYNNHWLDLGIIPDHITAADRALWPETGSKALIMYLTGYIVELSLSADNVFLFIVLMNFFAVPMALQHRVLFWGVIGALVMRGVMIGGMAAILDQFSWVIYIFGAFLVFTGIKMFFPSKEEANPANSPAVRLVEKIIPIHHGYEGKAFFVRKEGKLFATTLFLVLVAIEFTDLVFALDSIPAIFGITRDSFIVFSSNVFAILGLRSMYFLLAGVMDKFHLLKYGLAFILSFVGIKMLMPVAGRLFAYFTQQEDPHWHLEPTISLSVILGALIITIIASLMIPAKKSHGAPKAQPAEHKA